MKVIGKHMLSKKFHKNFTNIALERACPKVENGLKSCLGALRVNIIDKIVPFLVDEIFKLFQKCSLG